MRRLLFLPLLVPSLVAAQSSRSDSLAVIAVADSMLAAITANDWERTASFLHERGVIIGVRGEGAQATASIRTREETRTYRTTATLQERGFDARAMVDGPIAMVWLPYDFHVNGEWSHCGVDIFTLIQTTAGWRVVNLTYSVSQPPACRKAGER
jgi:hypothetical protein